MTKANYIDWENLKNIPFFLCQVVEDEQNQEIVLYYLGERVFHDRTLYALCYCVVPADTKPHSRLG